MKYLHQVVENLIHRYKQGEKSLFEEILLNYKQTCSNWYRHVSSRVRITKCEFEREFELLLYNAILRYDPQLKDENKFDHYFAVALKMKVNDLIRHALANKNKISRKSISLSVKKHDIKDERVIYSMDLVDIMDSIFTYFNDEIDRNLIIMRVAGYRIEEIANKLNITKREYWSRMKNIKSKQKCVIELAMT